MASQPPRYRDERTGHLIPEYRSKRWDFGPNELYVYWWINPRPATERGDSDGVQWGWLWRFGTAFAEKPYPTKAAAAWAGIQAVFDMSTATRKKAMAILKKRKDAPEGG